MKKEIWHTYWISNDKQSSLLMGCGDSPESSIADAEEELEKNGYGLDGYLDDPFRV